MSNADRVGLAYVEESTWGVVPSGPPTLQDIRFTDEGFSQDTDTVESREIRSDRNVADVFRTNIKAGGDLGVELSYGTFDDFLTAALGSAAFSAEVVVAAADTGVAAVATGNKFTHATGWDNNPVVGTWIRVAGFATAANNGFFKVVTSDSTNCTVSDGTLVDESATPSVDVKQGGQAANGVAERSFVFERTYNDLLTADKLLYYLGQSVDTMSLNISTNSIIPASFGFMGKSEVDGAGATVGDGSNTAATTTTVMNTIDHVAQVREGGTTMGIINFVLNTANGLRERPQVATLGPISLGRGKFRASGTLQAYFTTKAIMDKYLAFTTTSLSVGVTDASGNSYLIELPSVKLTLGKRVTGGENTDIIADLNWTAKLDTASTYTLKIAKFAA